MRMVGDSDECTLEEGDNNWYRSREIRRRAFLREFSVGGCELPLEILRDQIGKRTGVLQDIHPKKLEELVGSVFSDFMNCEVINLGGPNDAGIDLVLINSDQRYVVQVKRRTSLMKAEAVVGIREFLGAMLLRGEMKGIFVSTAPRFSPQATAAASLARERKLVDYIKLVDASRLMDVCELTAKQPIEPWREFAATPADPPLEFPLTVLAFPV